MVGKYERMRHLENLGTREITLKIDLKNISWKKAYWIEIGQRRIYRLASVLTVVKFWFTQHIC
jgi:hypothetical protein